MSTPSTTTPTVSTPQPLGLWSHVREKWPEIVISIILAIMGALVAWIGSSVYGLNREVGELSSGQVAQFERLSTQLDSRHNELVAVLNAANSRLDRLDEGIGEIDELKASIAVLEDRIKRPGEVRTIVPTNDTTHVNVEGPPTDSPYRSIPVFEAAAPTFTRGIVQNGMFSPETRVGDKGFVFRWKLGNSFDVVDVTRVVPSFLGDVPIGSSITAKIIDDGGTKFCEMTIDGDVDQLTKAVAAGISGQVLIEVTTAVDPPPAPAGPVPMPPEPAPPA